ncbi:MAG: hypothetical protein J7L42_03210 [Elusimicrobia bacterium]|nr:hypothetical protein [Elusimicrobiota bacterium]
MNLKPYPVVKRLTRCGIILFVCFLGTFVFAQNFSQVVSSTDILKGETVSFWLSISSASSISNVRLYYADGGHESFSYTYTQMTEVSFGSYTAVLTPQNKGYFDYYYFARVDGTNYCFCSSGAVTNFQIARDNPFRITVTEPDYTPPYIVHQWDTDDDEDDGSAGTYNGTANNGIADEDEDGLEHDPQSFADNLDTSDTGHPWGITTRTIKRAGISIKAIFRDYDGASTFNGTALLYYRKKGDTTYKKVQMSSAKDTTYAYDIDGSEVTCDIEYVLAAIDKSGNVSICDRDSFMYSKDGKDNDGDGLIDEEANDGEDNDGDGFIDEDLSDEGTFLIKAEGKCSNKSSISPSSAEEWIEDALYNQNSTYFAKPFCIRVYEDALSVEDFDARISKQGTVQTDIYGNEIYTGILFPGDVEITVYDGTFAYDVYINIRVPEEVPSLSQKSGLRETGYIREIIVRDIYGNEINYFSKPIVVNFRRPLLSLDSSYMIAYFYNGEEWIPVGGERADIDADQQVGYGKPLIVRINQSGIFEIVEDYTLWDGVHSGITKLKTQPRVFNPERGSQNTTVISFFFASNDSPSAIGDVPLYAEVPVSIKIFDIRGNLIRNLVKDEYVKFGWVQGSLIQFSWDGKNDRGQFVEPGFYMIQVQATNDFPWLTQDKDKNFFQRTGVVVVR